MTRILTLPPDGRLLVFAPHPDDETLATGELIQLARQQGARVRVVFATDGDNNPWPQRWTERRWRIDAPARARWGARRRGEALAALARLGLDADAARFLGWPDLGLTRLLERDDRAVDTLADEIRAFAPTHVAMPSLHDRHPDHGALRVMADLALAKARASCLRLGYVVHGRKDGLASWTLPQDAARQRRKVDALLAHESQIRLSRDRLLRWAGQSEAFERTDGGAAIDVSARPVLRIALGSTLRFWRRHDVLVVLADADGIDRTRVRLPRFARAAPAEVLVEDACSGRIAIGVSDGALWIAPVHPLRADTQGFVKIERAAPRLVIFDVDTWQRFEDIAALPESSPAPAVAVTQRATL
ncbi:MAG TPA: PIG-L family deacetylase [Rhodanobacteraceae bacterium]|nr:PIG-L family deacetylase [Rhodanobacteraceae bacterium]